MTKNTEKAEGARVSKGGKANASNPPLLTRAPSAPQTKKSLRTSFANSSDKMTG